MFFVSKRGDLISASRVAQRGVSKRKKKNCHQKTKSKNTHSSIHDTRSSGLAKTILQDTVKGGRRQGGQRKRWEDNIREWTGLEFGKSQRAVENREKWRKLVAKSSVVPQRSSR